jgi:hypothetical protein
MEPTRGQKIYIRTMFCWVLFSSTAVALLNWKQPIKHAATCMGLGLVLLWIAFCGGLMVRFRDPIVAYVSSIKLKWQVRFVLFCTLFAMTEEAITTLMTNTAPLYGLKIGQAYITAGSNYIDVILLHGVSLFVSFFVGWAVILTRYRFSPFAVFILFGITGTLIETVFGGPLHILEYGMWAFVYGLMIWLPAYTVPRDYAAQDAPQDHYPRANLQPPYNPRWYHYPLAVFVPMLFVFLFPLLGVISLFFPHHPQFHFPPMGQ